MMLYYIHIKRFVIWALVTFLFGVIVSLAFLFSRDLTLNTVKINEFKIYYSFLNKQNEFKKEEIRDHFNILLSYKKYPLLPIALISEEECIENVSGYYDKRFDLSICKELNYKLLKSSNELNIYSYYESNIIEYNNKSFIFKKLDDSDRWLLARIKDYYRFNNHIRFINFITNEKEGMSWISSLKSFNKFLVKSKFIWSVIIPFSTVLFVLFTLYYLTQTRKLDKLNIEKNKYISKWNKLNIEIQDLTAEQIKLEEELKRKEIDSSDDEINILRAKNEELKKDINIHLDRLKEIEKNEDIIVNKLNEASKTLTAKEKEKMLDDSLDRLNKLDLLWKYKPSWQERHSIENTVSLRDKFTPFTISQAFICFEKIIENLVIQENEEFKNNTLIEQINIIFENNLLPIRFEDDLHSIRKARNKWFHSGKQPSEKVYTILLDILDKTNTQPLL